jgi:hypothetical protein
MKRAIAIIPGLRASDTSPGRQMCSADQTRRAQV